MEASAADKGCSSSRPLAFEKMEGLVKEMQDPETGVPVRCQKLFLTSIPSAFMGYDLIEWLMDRLNIEESVEALHIGNLLCQYGYFFPVSDTKNLVVKDDSSLYRFQAPVYWPWQTIKMPDNVEYAIYLVKRTLRNKQRHGLEDYEMEALSNLKKNLQNKWECIVLQADEQVRKAKGMKKCDKIVLDSQERAYWRVNRPPPGFLHSLEYIPIPSRNRSSKPKKRAEEDVQREIDFLRRCLDRTRIKMSVALESLMQYCDLFCEWDPMTTPPQPSNPWVSEDPTFWMLNSPIVEIPTEKRVRRWAISMEELVSDPTGLQEFTNYLRKEYSHENIRFWLAVNDLRRSSQREIPQKVKEIFNEFLAPGAPCEVNIDGKTMERTQQELRSPSRFTFDPAAEHVYTLLLKKDCYPRFRRSEIYKQLLAAGVQPSAKKRFFNFGGQGKKKTANQPQALLQQQQSTAASQQAPQGSLAGRRRGSDRSLSGSAHELAVSGVKELNRTVSHSHSQSNLSDIPYRGDLPSKVTSSLWSSLDPPGGSSDEGAGEARSKADDVCPWDSGPSATTALACPEQFGRTSRKNSSQLDSGGSSSDISIAIAEVSERLRKSVCVQQHSVTGSPGAAGTAGAGPSSDGRRLMAGHRDTRRASESLVSGRPSVSSSEDLATPQRSFDSAGPSAEPAASPAGPASPAPTATTPATPIPTPAAPLREASAEEEAGTATPPAGKLVKHIVKQASKQASVEERGKQEARFEDRAQQTELARPHRQHSHHHNKDSVRTTKKSTRKKSTSSTPLISVSSVVDDTFDNSDETGKSPGPAPCPAPSPAIIAVPDSPSPRTSHQPQETGAAGGDPSRGAEAVAASGAASGATSGVVPGAASGAIPGGLVAPLAQQEDEGTAPPSPSAGPSCPPDLAPSADPSAAPSAAPPLAASKSEDRGSVERGSSQEGKVNEICPWEDEESCKVDEPFTKKYSHFGYL